jgi:hypothetical protein
VRKSAIRPVPAFARIPRYALDRVRADLLAEGRKAHDSLDEAFEDFERSQPVVSAYVRQILGRPLGEATLALGFFLSLAVWMAFEKCYGHALQSVNAQEFSSTSQLVRLDENLRQGEPTESLETDDVISMEQPALVEFVHEHMDATLNLRSADVDADELQLIYRMVLIEMLALSYAVQPPVGLPVRNVEVLA